MVLMQEDGIDFEEMVNRLQLPEDEVLEMELRIFNRYPIVSATNLFGQQLYYKFNSNTLKMREIEDVTTNTTTTQL
jgi:hypothetical protein